MRRKSGVTRYLAGITALYNRARDIALAAYDGQAAAEAIVVLAETIHRREHERRRAVAEFGGSDALPIWARSRQQRASYRIDRTAAETVGGASSDSERGFGYHDLGVALGMLGARESGTARLEEAVSAYREALKERTRERAPLEWATTQIESRHRACDGSASARTERGRLEEAVAAYREALKEETRERVPLDWARDAEQSRQCARAARRARERDGAARGGGRGLSRGA